MAFQENFPFRCKLILNNESIEQVSSFEFLGCDLSYKTEIDTGGKQKDLNTCVGLDSKANLKRYCTYF